MTTVVDGEVVTSELRQREREDVRTSDALPLDVDTKVSALRRLESPEAQSAAVSVMLSHSRTGLLAAVAAQDLPGIAEYKRKARAIEDIAKQVRLGNEIQDDAAEFCRRAERGLGSALRDGQANGTVLKRGEHLSSPTVGEHRISPESVATRSELNGSGRGPGGDGIYAMTDGVTDEQFEEAITEARAENNLSRANVARKAKAKAKPVPEPDIDAEVQPRPDVISTVRPFKKSDTEMLAEIAGSLRNFADLIGYITPHAIDADEARRLCDQAGSALGEIRKSLKGIRNAQA